jgi:MFS family permease
MSRAQRHPHVVLALVCLPVFIGALDLTIVSAVLPEVISSLRIEIQKLDVAGWVVTGYFVSCAVSMTFMGKVSDIAGRRLVYLVCLVIFFVGSWLVAASPGWPARLMLRAMELFQENPQPSFASLYALIAGRVVQAFGAGAMVPVSMALVADLYPPARRALPLGIVGAVDTAGWVLGHLYGGIMVQFMSWPYLFWINLPIVVVSFGLTWWALSGLPGLHAKSRIDWIGVTLLAIALILLNVGLGAPEPDLAGPTAAPSPDRLLWVAGAAAVFAVFLMTQRRIRDPILDLRIFSNRNLSAASGINLLVGFCIMVALVSVPIFINVAGAAGTIKAALVTGYLLCAFTYDGARRSPRRLALGAAGLSVDCCGWLDDRHRRLRADEPLANGDGGAGGGVLRQPAPRTGSVTGPRHRVHGGRAGAGRNRARLDHRADSHRGRQRRRRSRARHGVITRHHPPAHWHEHQHEFDDRVRPAAHDAAEPSADRPGGRPGSGEDGQGRA